MEMPKTAKGSAEHSGNPVTFIINGKDVASASSFPVIDPATGETLWRSASISNAEAAEAVEAAEAAFPSWSKTKPSYRRDIMFRAADLFLARKQELLSYQSRETGAGAQFMEININATIQILKDLGGRIEAAVQGLAPVTAEAGSYAMLIKEPYGVILAIAPWNAPYVLGVRSIAFALATGNTTVLKGSELSPRVFWAIGDIFRQAGLPDGCLNVIYHRTSDAADITQALIAHPAVKKINFTGSTHVGSIVASLAGKYVKPLLLELGGKASAIVLKDADLQKAATSCAVGAFIHGGQVCMATERILVHQSIVDDFAAAFTTATQRLFGAQVPPFVLINSAAVAKNKKLLRDALSKGATLLLGDPEATEDQPTKMRPVVVSNVSSDMDMYHAESFGPTVSLITFETEEEALAVANDTDYGLSGAVFSEDLRAAMRVARQYETGAVHINSMTVHDEASLVHGGVKKSGYDGSQKPYGCPYCPVVSSRKDVIVRHTKNFHSGVANRSPNVHRGTRRRGSISRGLALAAPGNDSSWSSAAAGLAVDDNSEEQNDPIDELSGSPENDDIGGIFYGSPENDDMGRLQGTGEEDTLGALLPSHGDLFPSYLQGDPLNFSSSFVDSDLMNPNILGLIGLLSNAGGFIGGTQNSNATGLPPLLMEPPQPQEPTSTDPAHDEGNGEPAHDDDCGRALANLAKCPANIVSSLRFPSKFAIQRFVKAFFDHVAAHIPIVHEPTFDIATAPSPLLLATMACGAGYQGERSTAVSMHSVAIQLILEHERRAVPWMTHSEPQIWTLQTYILLSYYGVHCGLESLVTHTLPHSLAQEALGKPNRSPATTYRDWVCQETINRCIAGVIIIGATIGSKERELILASSVIEARFVIPSSTTEWEKDEASWEAPPQALYSDDALNRIFAGQEPDLPVSEFGLVTIVAAILYHVCSFEILTGSHHAELFSNFGEKMEGSVWILDRMLKSWISGAKPELVPSATVQCAKSLLNSVFYHLYGSIPLAIMKKWVLSPAASDNTEDISKLLDKASSPNLYKALIRAADQLRFDCRFGLKRLQRLATLQFGPEPAVAIYEGGLLLFWYLQFAHLRLPQVESRNVLSALIDEGFAEVADWQLELQVCSAALPLAVSSELLSDETGIWKCKVPLYSS
ncbi:uncharacterized protein DNG_00038 [Cephalotrichum gorgonifer]|uniref:Aldedh domain-containing protein n=1 Tax=Cephalotrichum gorgonifer TaxID=2041049 RepID=A0AAE8MPL8_9PEZI|nr:uncharacterized protein DNG_00038 [Cephalotrichum gorgonifer]